MRWVRILLFLLIGVAIVIGGAIYFVATLDPNDYRDELERFAQRTLGRDVTIEGRIDLQLGEMTTIELANARLGNPDWASAPYMARIGHATIVIDLRSLVDGPLRIELIELHDSELNLESLQDGRNNWTFSKPDTGGRRTGSGSKLLPPIIHHAAATNFTFQLITPTLERPLDIRIHRLTQEQDPDGMLAATVSGVLNGQTMAVTSHYGPRSNLLAATDVKYAVDVRLPHMTIAGRGTVDNLANPRLPTLEISATSPDIDELTGTLGLRNLGGGKMDLHASIQPANGELAFRLAGEIGAYQVDLDGQVTALTELRRFSVNAALNGPDLGRALKLIGVEDVPGGPFKMAGNISREGPALTIESAHLSIGEATMEVSGAVTDFRNLDGANLNVHITGDDVELFRALIGAPGAATGPFLVNADLKVRDDGAELLEVFVQTNIASLKIDGEIFGKAPAFIGTKLKFDGTGQNLADFAETYGIAHPIAKPFSINGAVELGNNVIVTNEPVAFKIGDDTMTVAGTIGYQPLERDTRLRINASGEDLAQIVAMAGLTERIPTVSYDISTSLTVLADTYSIGDSKAKLGRGSLEVTGSIAKTADLNGTDLSFTATGPELREFVTNAPVSQYTNSPFKFSGRIAIRNDALQLQQLDFWVAGLTGLLNADIGIPIEPLEGSFSLAASGADLAAALPSIRNWSPPQAAFKLETRGEVAAGLWTIETMTAQLGDARFGGVGTIERPPGTTRTQLDLWAKVPSLAEIGLINERRLPAEDADLKLTFTGLPESYSIDPFTARSGKSDVRGSLTSKVDVAVPEYAIVLQSRLLDISPFAPTDSAPSSAADDGSQSDEAPLESGGKRRIPDWPLPLAQLRKFNGTIDIDVDRALLRGVEYDELKIDGELRDGSLTIERATVETPNGGASGIISLVPTPAGADVTTNFNGTGIYLGFRDTRTVEEVKNAPRLQARIELAGSGETLREVMATANGHIHVAASPGRIPNTGASLLFGNFFEELITTINPIAKQESHTELACLVLLMDVNNGLMEAAPGLIAQTDKINIASTGQISLIDESIDLNFKTAPRSKLSISAGELINPYLKVAGTLAEPRVMLDASSAIVTTGAAVATLGISFLATAVWDRVFRADDPCAAAIEEAKQDKPAGEKKKKGFLGIF